VVGCEFGWGECVELVDYLVEVYGYFFVCYFVVEMVLLYGVIVGVF